MASNGRPVIPILNIFERSREKEGERREIYQPHWQKSWKARLPLRYQCLAECRSQRV